MTDQPNQLPVSTCPRTDRHSYHMWPELTGPAFCPGRPAPDNPAASDDDQLTADEARAEVDRLATELYRAQDALDYVGECCDIAEREQRPVTTADVRAWLKGARCGRQPLADGLPCSLHALNRPHPAHNWEPQPGMTPVHCPGVEAASDDGLREQLVAALKRVRVWRTINGCDGWEYAGTEALADAVTAVRDRRMEQLADQHRRLGIELEHWQTVIVPELQQRAEQAEAEVQRLLRESPWLRASDEDRQTAEETVTRVIDLHEQWTAAGPPPLGTSINRWWDKRLAELRQALTEPAPAEQQPPAPQHGGNIGWNDPEETHR